MEKQTIYSALLFASFAAAGNALFAFGQRRSTEVTHPFLFVTSTLVVCLVLFAVTSFLLPKPDVPSFVRGNYLWVLISGLGFYFTSVGFYFLYTRHGASHYVIYAVLSIVATSIVVGIVIFKEPFNRYHFLSIVTAILTVVLFTVGQMKSG